jgi:hypothetical protein
MGLKFTNPWWVVVGAVTGLFVCNGPVLGFTFGVFLKPIMADTGVSAAPHHSPCRLAGSSAPWLCRSSGA